MNAYLNWGGTSSRARPALLWQFAFDFVVGGLAFGFELSHTVVRPLVESANEGSGVFVAVSPAFESWSEHTAPGMSSHRFHAGGDRWLRPIELRRGDPATGSGPPGDHEVSVCPG
ncbi:MAG TPA: hypothetical protein VML94_03310 [Thermoplasmata archaeon]|nr:hypothetical protein [Thermoplasmata archaeon]